MVGREQREHRLLAQLVALGAVRHVRRRREVLEADGGVQLARRHRGAVGLRRALDRLDLHLRSLLVQLRDRRGDDRAERARERADPQGLALRGDQVGQLRVGLGEPLGDRVGVGEQQRAGLGGRRAARPAVEQAHADLPLERGDLLGDRRLGERERVGRPRERATVGDLAEGEQPARFEHSHSLCDGQEGNLNKWAHEATMNAMDPLSFLIAHDATRRLIDGAQTSDARRVRRPPNRSRRVRT